MMKRFRIMVGLVFMMTSTGHAKDRTTVQSIIDGMVKIPGREFWLSETELTQGQWEAVMGNNPSEHKGSLLPVECVSRDDADVFIEKLNAHTDVKSLNFCFALPDPGDWLYAAEPTGSCPIEDRSWTKENSAGKTHEVATKKPNAFGIYDTQGNVWEWLAGPKDKKGERRGGSFADGAKGCSVQRWIHTPRGRRYGSCGLRVAAYLRDGEKRSAEASGNERDFPRVRDKGKIYVGKDNSGTDRYMVRYSTKESEDAAVEVYNAVKDSLVIIEGKKGAGSGFVAEADGKKWVYSNEHVSRIGHPLKATFINGKEINFKGPIQVASNRDLVRMEITDDVGALKISPIH